MKRLLLFFLSIIPFLGHAQFPSPGNAKILEPSKWKVSYSKQEVKVNDKVDVIITVEIDKGWHINALSEPPSSITFQEHPSFSLVGKIKEGPGIIKEYSNEFERDIRYYEHKAEFRQTIKILQPNPEIKVEIQGQVCSMANGQCIPVDKTLDAGSLKVIGAAATSPTDTKVKIENIDPVKENKNVAVNSPVDQSQKDSSSAISKPVMEKNPAEKYADNIESKATNEDVSLLAFLIIAFGGGLISLLTPCVFPMVPLTVTFFTNASKTRSGAFKKAFIYGTSIVFIFTVIGLIISWTLGPQFATFLSNHWIPNLLFFLIFIVFGLSFLGLFEITLPSSLVTKVDTQADKGGYAGIFFMAVTLVLVSFSCTAPIVSPLLIAASRGEAVKPVLGMLAYSSAFALPFTFFALFPGLLSKLPKSGGWMNVIKVTLGFIELALAFKFLSAVDRVYTLHILDRDIFIAIWIVVFTLLGVYFLGKIRLPHDSEVTTVSIPRLLLAIMTFTFVVYLIPGMFGAPLNTLSGVLPPMSTHNFDLPGIIRENTSHGKVMCDEPKYSKKYVMPHGLKGYFEYEQALRCAKESNKPLFIDFTGLNCANCIKMEENVWADQEVLNILNNEYVLVSLYTDDPTPLPKEEIYVSPFDNEEKKTIGERNNDIQIRQFHSNTLPYYILLDPNTEQPLIEGVGYTPSIVNYIKYLNQGVEKFKQLKSK